MRGPGNGLLMSEHMAQAFREEGLKGIGDFQPVAITHVVKRGKGRKQSSVPRYVYGVPAWGSAAVDEARSHIRRSEPIACDLCRETGVDAIHGYHLEVGSWNDDDIFRARGLSGFTTSERFERFVARHCFTNLRLTPTHLYTWDPLAPEPAR